MKQVAEPDAIGNHVAKTLIRANALPLATAGAAVLRGKSALIIGEGSLAGDIIAGWNMHVTTVDDGLSALIAIDEAARLDRPFDVVLIDRHPPETGGEVADAIRRLETGREIKLILCAATGRDAAPAVHAALGFDAVVFKPLTSGGVLDALRLALGAPEESQDVSAARALIANHSRELDAMRSDLWSGDRYTLRCRAQTLKGAARAIGAQRLLEIAELLETEAATMGQAEAFAQIERLARLFTEATEELPARTGSVVA